MPPAPLHPTLVRVFFPKADATYTYFNDQFALQCGDLVFVDGKMAGKRGRVVEVIHHFKVKPSHYQRVIAAADTQVHGTFRTAGTHLVTFDAAALPYHQVRSWFLPPEEDVYVMVPDSIPYPLHDLAQFPIASHIAERGHDYYTGNRVRYLRIENGNGVALVEGTEVYEVTFRYDDGMVSDLLCSCPCDFNCKHIFAALLQLRETLTAVESLLSSAEVPACVTAIHLPALMDVTLYGRTGISLSL